MGIGRNLVLVESIKILGVVVKGLDQIFKNRSVDRCLRRRRLHHRRRPSSDASPIDLCATTTTLAFVVQDSQALEFHGSNRQNPIMVLVVCGQCRKGRGGLFGGNGVLGNELLFVGKMRPQQLKDFQEGVKGRILQGSVEGFRADLVLVVHGFDADRGRGLHSRNGCGGAGGSASSIRRCIVGFDLLLL